LDSLYARNCIRKPNLAGERTVRHVHPDSDPLNVGLRPMHLPNFLSRALCAAIIVPVGFEASVRVDELIRFGVPITSGVSSIADLQVIDSLGLHARAGVAFRNFRINSHGFRGQEIDDARIRTSPVVVTAGSSETFGLYESPTKEWPQQLSDSLAIECRESPPVVLNAAYAGMGLPSVISDVSMRIRRFAPRVVVYYPQPTQYLFDETPRRVAPREGDVPAVSPWNMRSPMRLRTEVKAILPTSLLSVLRVADLRRSRQSSAPVFAESPRDRLEMFDLQIRELIGAVRTIGATPLLVSPQHRFSDTTSAESKVWLRAWEKLIPRAPAHVLLSFTDSAQARLKQVSLDSSVYLVEPPFAADSLRARQFADPVHFSDIGASLVAGEVARAIARPLGCESSGALSTREDSPRESRR
jgi:hypothetical protein